MSKELLGDVCAYIPSRKEDEKARYPRIGTAFKDEHGRISLKIDTLPIPGDAWSGWINVFPPKPRTPDALQAATDRRPRGSVMGDGLEDEPF